ncbi:hypothetical protein AVEN_147125-1 [Araneus ventricosus]|uniref:Reverse transcriptase domain-containing protein n=1 Tax=Araneus ventricosus TaxID=182803 RepID=A0A4Y2GCA9_ARAVE|nr:hypothetical protein AVEN_147125-1 [Araneus ventricosus]
MLYGAATWAFNITSRQKQLLSSIHRKFLLGISGAYNTTPTASLQLIEDLIPLHIKAKQEATLLWVIRLKRNCTNEGAILDYADYEQPLPRQPIHPARFNL